MTIEVTVDTWVLALLAGCWLVAGVLALGWVIWMHRRWRQRMRAR